MSTQGTRTVTYRCTNENCGAEDHPVFFAHERILPMLNCWKCHAGFQRPIQECIEYRIGMFPVEEERARA